MSSLGRGLGGAIFAAAIVVACSSGGGGGGASNASAFITSFCDSLGTCCTKFDKTYNQKKCVDFYNAVLGTATYNAANGESCLAKTRAAQGNADFCENGAEDDEICKKVFEKAGASGGTKQPGELCSSDAECASQADGDVNCSIFFANDATTKKCQVYLRAKEGDGCVGGKDEDDSITTSGSDEAPRIGICWVADSLYCDGKTKKCAKLIADGESCSSSFGTNPCQKTSRCDFKTSMCTRILADGEACTPNTSSSDNPCGEKSYCDGTSKCVPALKRGAPCTKQDECGGASCSGGKCGGSSNTISESLACD